MRKPSCGDIQGLLLELILCEDDSAERRVKVDLFGEEASESGDLAERFPRRLKHSCECFDMTLLSRDLRFE